MRQKSPARKKSRRFRSICPPIWPTCATCKFLKSKQPQAKQMPKRPSARLQTPPPTSNTTTAETECNSAKSKRAQKAPAYKKNGACAIRRTPRQKKFTFYRHEGRTADLLCGNYFPLAVTGGSSSAPQAVTAFPRFSKSCLTQFRCYARATAWADSWEWQA